MIKQFIFATIISFFGFAVMANEKCTSEANSSINSAVRNSNHFTYNKVAGNLKTTEEVNLSDDFNLPVLRQNWATKSESELWSLKERPGFLRLKSQLKKEEEQMTTASFSKLIEFNTTGEAVCYFDLSNLKEGNETGMYFSNKDVNFIQIKVINGIKRLEVVVKDKIYNGPIIDKSNIMFRTRIEPTKVWFEYSTDGLNFNKLGEAFTLNASYNQSDYIGIFCQNQTDKGGSTDIDWFYFKKEKKSALHYTEIIKN